MPPRCNSIRDPCGHCVLQVKDDGHGALQCHRCDFWFDLKRTSVPAVLLTHLKKVEGLGWLGESCESPAKEALSMSSPKVDEVRKLRESVDELRKNFVSVNEIKRELTEIKSLVNSSSSEVNNIKVELSKPKPHPPEQPAVTLKLLENSISDRSILVIGIDEHEPTLKSSERLEKDLSTAKNLIEKVDPCICSIKDLHRIGKLTHDHKPRPIVITFQSQWDKRMALSKSYMLKNTKLILKTMLTPEKRALEKQLLNLRFKLSNVSIPKHEMKILNLKLYHGKTVLDHSKAPDVLAKQIKDN